MNELKLTGNCLKGSRPLLSFDAAFDATLYYKVIKDLLVQSLGTPRGHKRSKPFFDHVLSFSIADDRIWVRNYQFLETKDDDGHVATRVEEIGPRMALTPIRIFDGSFGGPTIYENPNYVPRREIRRADKERASQKYKVRKVGEKKREGRRAAFGVPEDPLEDAFDE